MKSLTAPAAPTGSTLNVVGSALADQMLRPNSILEAAYKGSFWDSFLSGFWGRSLDLGVEPFTAANADLHIVSSATPERASASSPLWQYHYSITNTTDQNIINVRWEAASLYIRNLPPGETISNTRPSFGSPVVQESIIQYGPNNMEIIVAAPVPPEQGGVLREVSPSS